MSQSIIIPRDELKNTLKFIQEVLNKGYEVGESSNMLELLQECSTLLGNSSLAVASAKYWYEAANKLHMEEYFKRVAAKELPDLKPLNLKDYIDGCCASEIGALKLAERQNSALNHKQEAIISSLIYLKAEMTKLQ